MSEKDKSYFPELSKFRDVGHSLISAMNMYSKSLVDFIKERDRLLAEIEQLKKRACGIRRRCKGTEDVS